MSFNAEHNLQAVVFATLFPRLDFTNFWTLATPATGACVYAFSVTSPTTGTANSPICGTNTNMHSQFYCVSSFIILSLNNDKGYFFIIQFFSELQLQVMSYGNRTQAFNPGGTNESYQITPTALFRGYFEVTNWHENRSNLWRNPLQRISRHCANQVGKAVTTWMQFFLVYVETGASTTTTPIAFTFANTAGTRSWKVSWFKDIARACLMKGIWEAWGQAYAIFQLYDAYYTTRVSSNLLYAALIYHLYGSISPDYLVWLGQGGFGEVYQGESCRNRGRMTQSCWIEQKNKPSSTSGTFSEYW